MAPVAPPQEILTSTDIIAVLTKGTLQDVELLRSCEIDSQCKIGDEFSDLLTDIWDCHVACDCYNDICGGICSFANKKIVHWDNRKSTTEWKDMMRFLNGKSGFKYVIVSWGDDITEFNSVMNLIGRKKY